MPTVDSVANSLRRVTEDWIDSRRNSDRTVNPGILATAVAVTSHLRNSFPLTEEVVATKSQIRGQSGSGVGQVLSRFGENRKFLAEAGRTSRGSRDAGIALAKELSDAGTAAGYAELDDNAREGAVDILQGWLVVRLGEEFFDQQRIEADLIDPSRPARSAVEAVLSAAISRGGNAAGAVAQHLVGAKLSLRFPGEDVGRDSYTTADKQTARAGDFQIGDAAFHVTMSPSEKLLRDRCVQNIQDGFRPVVLVPEAKIAAAIQLSVIAGIDGRVDVIGLESFVGLNVEEMAGFSSGGVRRGLRLLLETYNHRITEIESNLSLQVQIPSNL